MNGLENLKKGDKAICIHRGFGTTTVHGAVIIDHVTKTLIVGNSHGDIHGSRIRIATAKEVGEDRFSGTQWYAESHPAVAQVRKAQ